MRRCLNCGAPLARDHSGDEWCSPCLRANRRYDPREDPYFLERLLECLCAAGPGITVRPLAALGLGYEYRDFVKTQIRLLRRRGYDIRAVEREAGYRYCGVVMVAQTSLPLGLGITSTSPLTA